MVSMTSADEKHTANAPGPVAGCPVQHDTTARAAAGKSNSHEKGGGHDGTANGGGCPVKHNASTPSSSRSPSSPHAPASIDGGGCPVNHSSSAMSSSSGSGGSAYNPFDASHNVISTQHQQQQQQHQKQKQSSQEPQSDHQSQAYNEAANDMAFSSNQEFSDQTQALGTVRTISNIPKSDFTPGHQPAGHHNWVYPSGGFAHVKL
jgi:hypothetical protein